MGRRLLLDGNVSIELRVIEVQVHKGICLRTCTSIFYVGGIHARATGEHRIGFRTSIIYHLFIHAFVVGEYIVGEPVKRRNIS